MENVVENKEKQGKTKSKKQDAIEWVLTFVIPIILAVLIHTFLFTFAMVDGESMMDTFQSNNITGVSRLYRFNCEPQRGEVITVHYDESKKLYIKRVIGLPGEKVELVGGTLYINDEPMTEGYLTRIDTRDFGPYFVGENEIFVMGDNRPVSNDSRYVGPLPMEYVYGKVIFVAFPFDQMRGTTKIPVYD